MDQEWHETVGRQQEWEADQLKAPWAVRIDLGGVKILDRESNVVAKMVMPNDDLAALAAAEIIDVINRRY
jgi:hypothetical protein